jgi:DNA-binding PadR family transcriptional regulator
MRNSSPLSFDIREAVESLRDAFAPRASGHSPFSHGDIRSAVLAALSHEPRNGHQVMQAIAASRGGSRMPAASQVYPTLQQLTDEGLVRTQHDGERTVYELTDAGRAAAADAATTHAPAGEQGSRTAHDDRGWSMPRWDEHTAAVPKAGAKLAQAAAQVAQTGTREQKERAAALLDETRRKLYAILAED